MQSSQNIVQIDWKKWERLFGDTYIILSVIRILKGPLQFLGFFWIIGAILVKLNMWKEYIILKHSCSYHFYELRQTEYQIFIEIRNFELFFWNVTLPSNLKLEHCWFYNWNQYTYLSNRQHCFYDLVFELWLIFRKIFCFKFILSKLAYRKYFNSEFKSRKHAQKLLNCAE